MRVQSDVCSQSETTIADSKVVGPDVAMPVTIRSRIVEGNIKHVLVAEAAALGADLIILGHRDRSPLAAAFMDSITSYVIQHAPCSVLLAKTKKSVPMRQL